MGIFSYPYKDYLAVELEPKEQNEQSDYSVGREVVKNFFAKSAKRG
jgi:hypothetical protein